MAYLFSLALGPAQQFIAAARRTRDLWFSSWLLSELSKAAAREIGRDRLIFPFVDKDGDLKSESEFNVVNKILAKIDDDPRRLGESVKAAVHKRLNEIRDAALDDLPAGSCDLDKAKAQIDDLPEIYWAAVPLNGDYAHAREQVERLLAARKNTRDFGPTDKWRGNEWKSALDGLRESVIFKTAALEKQGVKKAETLCGVGLLKRLGKRDVRFWSTSHIAALPLILSLSRDHGAAVKKYREALEGLDIDGDAFHQPDSSPSQVFPYDGHILFEEQLKEFFDEGQKDNLRQAKVALKQLLREIAGGKSPSPYYAILHADGDRMGEVIDAQDEGKHKKLSAALSAFAGEVKKIVKAHHGSLIYAGGDDALALVPLHTVVKCARDLADEFSKRLVEFNSKEGRSPTLSVGIGILHQMEPLEDALNLAREAEKEAKRHDGKNALCIKVSKRSGTITTTVDHWGALDKRLDYFTLLHLANAVPDGAAYELRELANQLRQIPAAIKLEAIRILQRKRTGKGDKELEVRIVEKLKGMIKTDNLASLADELIVARLLAEAKMKSGMTTEQARACLQKESAK